MSGVKRLDHGKPESPDLVLLAPLDGWAAPLAEVPDPVFAEKMMGDGVAIDPIGQTLCAPCDGEVILLHAALHAVTLRAANGAEILMHIGLDTVALGGTGFTAHVAKGQRVKAGDRLISFDLDQLAQAARSLITPDHHRQWPGFFHRHTTGERDRRARPGSDAGAASGGIARGGYRARA